MKYQRYILNRFTRFTTNLFIIVALFSLCLCGQAMAGWQIEVVSTVTLELGISLAFDLSGFPAISFTTAPTGVMPLSLVRFNGSPNAFIDSGVGGSLAFDALGNPAVSFFDKDVNVLRFAHDKNGDGDFADTNERINIDSVGFVGLGDRTSLAFDALGNPAVSYQDFINNIKFASFNGISWNIIIVDSAGGADPSLAFDRSGNTAIAYVGSGGLKFARFNGASWDITTVDSTGGSAALAFDLLSGNPAISYHDRTNGDLKFARFNGATWDITTVDSVGDVGRDASLAFDASGNPAIAYFDGTNLDLKFAHFNGASWDITTVDSAGGNVGRDVSLAFDLSGNPAIAYLGKSGDLKFARFVPVTTTTSTTTTTTTTTSTTTTTFVCQCPASGNGGCISGTVTEVGTEEPLPGKTVLLKRLFPKRPVVRERVQTDDEGCYLFTELEDGIYKIKVRRCRGGGRKTVVVVNGLLRNDVNFECR